MKPGESRLRRAVVGLSHVAVEARRRGRVDDPRVRHRRARLVLRPPVVDRVARRAEGAAQVHPHDVVPHADVHVHEHLVAQDAGVVDQHVQLAEGVERRLHQATGAVPVGDVVVVPDGLAAELLDLRHDVVHRPDVVDHDAGSLPGELERVLTADPAAGTGDDDDASVVKSHWSAPSVGSRRAVRTARGRRRRPARWRRGSWRASPPGSSIARPSAMVRSNGRIG